MDFKVTRELSVLISGKFIDRMIFFITMNSRCKKVSTCQHMIFLYLLHWRAAKAYKSIKEEQDSWYPIIGVKGGFHGFVISTKLSCAGQYHLDCGATHLSSEFPTKQDSNQYPQLQRLAGKYKGSLTVWALYAYFSDSQNAAVELLVWRM